MHDQPNARLTGSLLLGLCSLIGITVQASAANLNVGDRAPLLNANDDQGNLWQMQGHTERGHYLVVYFYPAAMTGGCTKQACAYRDHRQDLSASDIEVVGISADPVSNLKHFRQAYQLNFKLLSDVNATIAGAFGVPKRDGGAIERQINGQTVTLIRPFTIMRWTFVLDPTGKIILKDTEVKADQDANKVLEAIRNHKKSLAGG